MIETVCIALRTLLPLVLILGAGYCTEDAAVQAVPGFLWSLALESSDALTASDLAVESASRARSASGRLPDPSLRIGWGVEPLETRDGPVDFTATFVQKIPWPGLLARRNEEAGYREELAGLQFLIRRLELRTLVTRVWADMFKTSAAITLYEDELERLSHLTGIAEIRYRSGQADLQSLLLLENRTVLVESRLVDQLLDLESLRLELESVIGMEISTLAWPDTLPGMEFYLEGLSLSHDIEDAPGVRFSAATGEFARATATVARADQYPDLEIGAVWSVVGDPLTEAGAVDPGGDALMVFAGLSLPLGYSGAAERFSASRLSAEAGQYLYLQTVSDQTAERQRLVNEIESLIHLYRSYVETVLPNLEAIRELSMAEWIAGIAGMDEVIGSLERLEEAGLEEKRIYSMIALTYAELITLDGRDTEKGEFL